MDDYMINKNIRRVLEMMLSVFLIMLASSMHIQGQDLIKTTDDFDEINDVYKSTGKLILAVFTEDSELEEDYFEYLEWHDSLVALLNKDYIVYKMRSDYNAVELLYSDSGLLSYIELEEDQEELYKFLQNISANKELISRYVDAQKYYNENGKLADKIQMHEYLTTSKNILQIAKEEVLNDYLKQVSSSEVQDSQDLDLVLYHTQNMGTGYTLLKKLIRSYQIVDDSIKTETKETLKRVLENTYLDILSMGDEEMLMLLYREINWYMEHLETQEWNNRYKYSLSKYNLASEKRGDKTELLDKTKLFVNNWIFNQIKSNAPFLTAEELAYDLAAFVDLMLDRKVPKSELPNIKPWIDESIRIFSGYQMHKVNTQLLNKMGMKQEAREEDRKLKWYKKNLSKEMIKSGERMMKDALDPEMILITFLDGYFFPEQYVLP